MYEENRIKGGYGDQYETLKASALSQERDASPVEKAMGRLSEVIVHAQSQAAELHGRLGPVLIPRPVESTKTGGGQVGTTCAIEERINIMAEQVQGLARQLREMRDMLAI